MCFGLLQGLLWCVEVPPSILCVACSVYGAGESGCDVVSSDEQAILRLCANVIRTVLSSVTPLSPVTPYLYLVVEVFG